MRKEFLCMKSMQRLLYQLDLSHSIGLYRFLENSEVIMIGQGIESNNRGLLKRITDFTRTEDGARDYTGGRYIYNNRDNLTVSFLVMNDLTPDEINTLKSQFINRYHPRLNRA